MHLVLGRSNVTSLAALHHFVAMSSNNLLTARFPCRMYCSLCDSPKQPTAGIIIIGDEILKGQTQDTNSYFLTRRLKELGILVRRISVIPDEVDEISVEVKQFAALYTFVLTSGGIGPTHDDVTYSGVANAFDDVLEDNAELSAFIRKWCDDNQYSEVHSTLAKFAKIPRMAKLHYANQENVEMAATKGLEVKYPLSSVQNVYIFPGIPQLLRTSFDYILAEMIKCHMSLSKPVRNLYVKSDEVAHAAELERLVSKYKDLACFGSYPEMDNGYYRTKITVEAQSEDTLSFIAKEVCNTMDVVEFDPHPEENSMEKLNSFLERLDDTNLREKIETSLGIIGKCYHAYSDNEIMLAVNGGKDCIVMSHLVHCFFQNNIQSSCPDISERSVKKLHAMYVRDSDPFTEVEEGIHKMASMYNLDLIEVPGPIKLALHKVLIEDQHQWNTDTVHACFMGTRMDDPGGMGIEAFSPTDGNWPRLMRVNPILRWDYHSIWKFIRGLNLLYPSLYDHGYTSLGSRTDTLPNPELKAIDSRGKVYYKPAYLLQDSSKERDGRLSP